MLDCLSGSVVQLCLSAGRMSDFDLVLPPAPGTSLSATVQTRTQQANRKLQPWTLHCTSAGSFRNVTPRRHHERQMIYLNGM